MRVQLWNPGWPAIARLVVGASMLTHIGSSAFAQGTSGAPKLEAPATAVGGPIDVIGVIEDFEAQSDAKCQATATRLENFIAGTPLTDEARFLKIDLQKALLADVWQAASAAASAAGEPAVTGAAIGRHIADALTYRSLEGGGWWVGAADGSHVELEGTAFRQYASVAYGLRAILGLQQDALLDSSLVLLPVDEDAVNRLKELVDVHTMAALALADREARLASRGEVNAESLHRAWMTLRSVPSVDDAAGRSTLSSTRPMPVVPSASDLPSSLPTFKPLVDAKLASYAAYNALSEESFHLLMENIRRYYARFPLAPAGASQALHRAFIERVGTYALEVMRFAQRHAQAAGRPLIRGEDAMAAVMALSPHEVDELEDTLFFPRLERHEQVRIEAYDMDSFRDFGTHWLILKRVIESPQNPLVIEPDPFAAEIFAEGVAQLGVLLYRLAGQQAATDGRSEFLAERHVRGAFETIVDRGRRNQAAPPTDRSPPRIFSATGSETAHDGPSMSDMTTEAGIAFAHRSSDWLSRFRRTVAVSPPTFSGGGLAAEDIDGDGRADLLFVGGKGVALYLATEQGTFRDVTADSGIDLRRPDGTHAEARQPIFADFDNDGLQDLLITVVDDAHRLYRGSGDGRFEDVSEQAGLGGIGLVGGPATVFDYDRDGLLDLYIGYFGNYIDGALPDDGEGANGALPTLARDNRNGLANRLFRNRGDFRFVDRTEESGTGDTGWAQAVGHTDFDGDGWQDLVVANDFGKNALLRNRGDGTFENVAERLGMVKAFHSMNIGTADLNGDRLPEIYISNINTLVKDSKYVNPSARTAANLDPKALASLRYNEASVLWTSVVDHQGGLQGYASSKAIDRGENTVGWAWDADFFDVDNDGDDDLYVVNGTNEYFFYHAMYIENEADDKKVVVLDWNRESNVLFVNEGGALRNRSRGSGMDLLVNARAAAYFDLDDDGDLDVALNNFHSPAAVLRNHAEKRANHWLKVQLVGDPGRGSNRDAIGARVIAITADGQQQWREVRSSTGYLSAHPKTVHFGLGSATAARLEVRWPNGEVEVLADLAAGRTWRVAQGSAPVTQEAREGAPEAH